jgi:putative nucleotidyltransferase with HDIG domain
VLEGRLDEAKAMLLGLLADSSKRGPYQLSLAAVHVRLLSFAAQLEGDWGEAYRWIRKALKEGLRQSYIMEEQFVVDQAVRVLRGLHDSRDVRTHEALVQDLVHLLEDKDWYTGRSHSRGVSHLAVRLGEILNQTRGWNLDLENLRISGLLHDVGKLRIPWSLLNKIAPITPKEMEMLREHSALGGELLRKMGLDDVARVVEQHHESFDGTGYPSGRPPDLDAAVVAVCDAYEASVTPNRRYKQPKATATVLAELITASGTRYHADVVDALLSIVQRDSGPAD